MPGRPRPTPGHHPAIRKSRKILATSDSCLALGCTAYQQRSRGKPCTFTLADQLEKPQTRFWLEPVVLAGDRGMLTQPQIETLRAHPGLG